MILLSSLFHLFSNKKRLLIEYAMIAAVIVIAAITFTLWVKKIETERDLNKTKLELTVVQSRLKSVEQINQSQDLIIVELKDLRIRDEKALTGLLQDYKMLANGNNLVKQRLSQLEKSNEVVREYLNQPINVDLACLLNNTCPRNKNN